MRVFTSLRWTRLRSFLRGRSFPGVDERVEVGVHILHRSAVLEEFAEAGSSEVCRGRGDPAGVQHLLDVTAMNI